MNIIIGTWVEVIADSVTRKTSVPKCSNNPNHSSIYYFGIGDFCPTCGNRIVRIEAEEKGPAFSVRDIVPDYSSGLVILDSKINFNKKRYTYILYDDSGNSALYSKLLTESDCSGAYYLDDVLWNAEQIQDTRDEFLRLHSSFLVSLDNLKIQYELITGAGIFDW
jgi:hypothetical protein